MTRRCARVSTSLFLLAVVAFAGCKDPREDVALARADASPDGRRGGAGGTASGSPGTGGNGGPVGPAAGGDADVTGQGGSGAVDAPAVDGGTDATLEPGATCVPNQPCTAGIGPCRQGSSTCATPTSAPGCADVGADDNKGGCTGLDVCNGGKCAAACAGSVPCTDGIKPCRKGATTCATPTSPSACADVGADDTKGGCAGGDVCSNGSCVAPCQSGVACTQGLGPCRKGVTTCASATAQPGCADSGADDSRGGCSNGNVCSNGSCIPPCNPGSCGTNNDCTSGQRQCPSGQCVQTPRNNCGNQGEKVGSCSNNACQYRCPSGQDDVGGNRCCPRGQVLMGGQCKTPCQNTCNSEGATGCSGSQQATCQRDSMGCLKLTGASACPSGQTCQGGATGSCKCSNTCNNLGQTRCQNGQVQKCQPVAGCNTFAPNGDCAGTGCGTYKGGVYCCTDCMNGDPDGKGNQCVSATPSCRVFVPESIAEEPD